MTPYDELRELFGTQEKVDEAKDLLEHHQHTEPYISNTLMQIVLLLERLKGGAGKV